MQFSWRPSRTGQGLHGEGRFLHFEGGPSNQPETVQPTETGEATPTNVDGTIKRTNDRLEQATKERDETLRSTEEALVKTVPGLNPAGRVKAVAELNRLAEARGATYRYELRGDAVVKVESTRGMRSPETAQDQALAKEVNAGLGASPTREQVDRAQTKLLLAGMSLRIGADGNPERGTDGAVVIDVPENPTMRGMLVLAGLLRSVADLWRGKAPQQAPTTTSAATQAPPGDASLARTQAATLTSASNGTPSSGPETAPGADAPPQSESAEKAMADLFQTYNENPRRLVNVALQPGASQNNFGLLLGMREDLSISKDDIGAQVSSLLLENGFGFRMSVGSDGKVDRISLANLTPERLRALAAILEQAVHKEEDDHDDDDTDGDEDNDTDADEDSDDQEEPAEDSEVKEAVETAKSRYSAALRRVPGVNQADIEGALKVESSKDSDGALRIAVELQPGSCGISEDMAETLTDGFQGAMGNGAVLFSDAGSIAELAQYTDRFVSLVDRYWPPPDSESTPELRRAADRARSSLTDILRNVAVDDRKLDVESAITVIPRDGKQVVGLHIGALSRVVPPRVIGAVCSSCFPGARVGRHMATGPLTSPEPGRESQSELAQFVERVRVAVAGAQNHPENAKWTADARAALTEEQNAARDMTRDAVAQLAGVRGVTSADGAIAVFRQPVASRPGGHFLVQFLPGTATGLSDADTTAIGTIFAQREMGVTEGGEPMVSAYESRFRSIDDARAFMKTFAEKTATLRS